MSQRNIPTPITSTPASPARASDQLRSDLYDLLAEFTATLEQIATEHDARIAALEAALVASPQSDVVPFAQSRTSWTARELATDLGVHVNTVRNWAALPGNHRMHISCLRLDQQLRFLSEHVAEWLARNQDRLPLEKEWTAS